MPSFLLYFGAMGPTGPFLPSVWTSLWVAMSALMQAVGSVVIGSIIDQYGRKWPACFASGLTLVGTDVQFVARSRATLMGGKMLSGLSIGAVMAVGTVYLAEVRFIDVTTNRARCWRQQDCTNQAAGTSTDVLGGVRHLCTGFGSGSHRNFRPRY